jgi:predicted metal-dependent phosphoesterase TrpH
MINLDLHVHSCFSFDCLTRPEQAIWQAKRKGLNGVAITDHETVQGGLAIATLNQDPDFLVIVGAEFATRIGDIIGLFLHEEITTREPFELIDEIHRQGGVAVLPHPYHGHELTPTIMERIDVVEAFNARERPSNNQRALALAKKWRKPIVSGSDAHFSRDIGTSRTIFSTTAIRSELLSHQCQYTTGYTPRYRMSASQIVKAVKLRRYYRIPYEVTRLVKRLAVGR